MAAGNNAFNLQGSTPNIQAPVTSQATNTTTPQGAALNYFQSGYKAPDPSSPLKKSTYTSADGSSVTHEYQQPAAPGSPQAAATQQQKDVQQYFPGMLNASGTPLNGTPATTTASTTGTTGTQTGTTGTTPATTTTTQPQTGYQAVSSGLINAGTTPNAQVGQATNDLKNFQLATAGTEANIASNPNLSLDTKQGLGQIVANRAAQELGAYQTGVQNALQGNQQNITALTNAGTLTPEALRFGGSGSALDPATVASGLAADVLAGRKSYADAVSALGYAGSAGQQFLNNAITSQNPNANIAQLSGQYAANQTNTTTAGTAATSAANTGYTNSLQEYNDNTAKYTALTGISQQVTNTLQNYANSGTLTDYNAAVNTLQGHLSNPDYQKFITAIGNAQASYQAILGSSGVTPTKADQDAVNALNPNSSASTIVAALNQLSADAHALIVVPSYQKLQTYQSQLGIQ